MSGVGALSIGDPLLLGVVALGTAPDGVVPLDAAADGLAVDGDVWLGEPTIVGVLPEPQPDNASTITATILSRNATDRAWGGTVVFTGRDAIR